MTSDPTANKPNSGEASAPKLPQKINWGAVSAIASVLLVIIGLPSLMLLPRHNLGWRVISESSILSADAQNSHVQLLVDGKLSRDVHLVRLKLANTGNQTIHASDFDEEVAPGQHGLAFRTATKAKVLSADVEEMNPHSRKAIDIQVVETPPCLVIPSFNLNPGESITIRTLVTPETHNMELVGHIVNVSIEDVSTAFLPLRNALSILGWPLVFLFLILWTAVYSRFWDKFPQRDWLYSLVLFSWMGTTLILVGLDIWSQMRAQLIF
jgi:hypothetical protein